MEGTVLGFSREMAMEYGVTAALLYQELKRKQHYWEAQGKLEDGFFWCDQNTIAEWILVHPNTIGKAASALEDASLIEKKISYKPGTSMPTTWWRVISESTPKVISRNHNESDFYIKADTSSNTEGGGDIPLAAVTTPFVEITIYDSDDSGKCIAVKHQVSPRDWNKAVRKWRKDESTSVMLELKDTGESERMTFNRIKKFDVRPKISGSVNQYNGGTAFQG